MFLNARAVLCAGVGRMKYTGSSVADRPYEMSPRCSGPEILSTVFAGARDWTAQRNHQPS